MARITNLETCLKNDPQVKDVLIRQLERTKTELSNEPHKEIQALNGAIDAAKDVISILAKRYK
ncbi:EscE/YscE/SsaE family type III secretion system needle protein co-chaperone [Vibrio pectenicida]|uniref:EscE/YscE/SsaE family type III secretion system needle protein co-chaperone n=1 Tax=Vibrio pectenicida TaxID=62763 RepID=A0A3R9EDC7_9VIBR|nr:EscE/YscE/SsaE family type III secretion system needle protein co-chaperone [Vibrio pectenicida]RSD31353.1 hypothetical protein EJA03_09040 [Vibrio pectenicida]